jgi:hypothetical protein
MAGTNRRTARFMVRARHIGMKAIGIASAVHAGIQAHKAFHYNYTSSASHVRNVMIPQAKRAYEIAKPAVSKAVGTVKRIASKFRE